MVKQIVILAPLVLAFGCRDHARSSSTAAKDVMYARPGAAIPSAMLSDLQPDEASGRLEMPRGGRQPLPAEVPDGR